MAPVKRDNDNTENCEDNVRESESDTVFKRPKLENSISEECSDTTTRGQQGDVANCNKVEEESSLQKTDGFEVFQKFCEAYFHTFGKHILQMESNETILHEAIKLGDYRAVEYLLDSLCNTGMKKPVEIISQPRMRNLVHTCVRNTSHLSGSSVDERQNTLQLLVELDAALLVKHKKIGETTPLLVDNIHLELIKSLIKHGTIPFENDNQGRNFLHKLTNIGPEDLHELVVYLIREIGPEDTLKLFNPYVPSTNGPRVPLLSLIKFIRKETLELLISIGVNIEDHNGLEDSVLHCAVMYGRQVDIIQCLINAGADMFHQNSLGSLLDTAAYHGNFEAVRYLISKGFNVNTPGFTGQRFPLQLALTGPSDNVNMFQIANYLLAHGANVNAISTRDRKSILCFVIVSARLKPDLIDRIRFLIENGATMEDAEGKLSMNWINDAALYLTAEKYHELLELLLSSQQAHVFAQLIKKEFAAVKSIVYVSNVESLKLLKSLGVDLHGKDELGRSLLHLAIHFRKDVSIIESHFSEFGVDATAVDNQGNGLLHQAASVDSLEIFRWVLSLGVCDINLKNKDGNTALHIAAERYPNANFNIIIKELLLKGADGSLKNKNGDTPFDKYSRNFQEHRSSSELLQILRREKLDGDSIFLAIEGGNIDKVKFECGMFTKSKGQLVSALWKNVKTDDEDEYSPLHTAARMGFLDCVKYLLEFQGFENLVLEDKEFSTLLHTCISTQVSCWDGIVKNEPYEKIIQLLVSVNGNLLNAPDPDNDNRTCVTLIEDNLPLLFFLIELGADLEVKDDHGYSFLHHASVNMNEHEYHKLIQFLVEKKLLEKFGQENHSKSPPLQSAIRNLNVLEQTLDLWWHHGRNSFEAVDTCGNSVFMTAVEAKKSNKLLNILITKFGVDCQRKNSKLVTALHIAANKGWSTAIDCLIKNGLNVNDIDNEGMTPLHWAVNSHWPNFTICDTLIRQGSNVQAVDNKGCSPLLTLMECNPSAASIPESYKKLRIARLLIKNGSDIRLKDGLGKNVMHYSAGMAAKVFHTFCEEIIKNGDGNCLTSTDINGRYPLHYGLMNEHPPLMKTLELFKNEGLDFKAMESESAGRNSLLHLVGRISKYKIAPFVSFLLENGADCKLKNKVGQTCLHLVAKSRDMESMALILKNGGPVNAKDIWGDTPLHYLLRSRSSYKLMKEGVKLLTKFGADLSAMNRRGLKPMDIFPTHGYESEEDNTPLFGLMETPEYYNLIVSSNDFSSSDNVDDDDNILTINHFDAFPTWRRLL